MEYVDELDLARAVHNALSAAADFSVDFGASDAETVPVEAVALTETPAGRQILTVTLMNGQQFSLTVDALR